MLLKNIYINKGHTHESYIFFKGIHTNININIMSVMVYAYKKKNEFLTDMRLAPRLFISCFLILRNI